MFTAPRDWMRAMTTATPSHKHVDLAAGTADRLKRKLRVRRGGGRRPLRKR